MTTHLWDMDTLWFTKPDNETINSTFAYKSWKDFQECKPYKLWKPYILSSWSWKVFSKEERRNWKRREPEKAVLDAQKLLRVNPSDYDAQKEPISSSAEYVEMLQIVFLSPDRFTGVHRVEIVIRKDDEEAVREWLKSHMPSFWKV
jgi:hypothetical protein